MLYENSSPFLTIRIKGAEHSIPGYKPLTSQKIQHSLVWNSLWNSYNPPQGLKRKVGKKKKRWMHIFTPFKIFKVKKAHYIIFLQFFYQDLTTLLFHYLIKILGWNVDTSCSANGIYDRPKKLNSKAAVNGRYQYQYYSVCNTGNFSTICFILELFTQAIVFLRPTRTYPNWI